MGEDLLGPGASPMPVFQPFLNEGPVICLQIQTTQSINSNLNKLNQIIATNAENIQKTGTIQKILSHI